MLFLFWAQVDGIGNTIEAASAESSIQDDPVLTLRIGVSENPKVNEPFTVTVFIPTDSQEVDLYGVSFKIKLEHTNVTIYENSIEAGNIWGDEYLEVFFVIEDGTTLDAGITKKDFLPASAFGELLLFDALVIEDGEVIISLLDAVAINSNGDPIEVDTQSLTFLIEEFALGIPVLSQPANNDPFVSLFANFTWFPVQEADSYEIEVLQWDDETEQYSITLVQETVIDTVYIPSEIFDIDGRYQWRVLAIEDGVSGEWSSYWFFTAASELDDVVLVYPTDSETGVPLIPTFQWGAVQHAETYHLQVSTIVDDFSSPVIAVSDITETSYTASELEPNTVYFVRVRAESPSLGVNSLNWSEPPTQFRTMLAPPVLISPENGETNVFLSSSLTWSEVPSAQSYELQIAVEPDFLTTVIDASSIMETSFELNELDFNRVYFWRVRAMNSENEGAWSEVNSFETTFGIPQILLPSNNAVDVSVSPTISWSLVENATTYQMQVSAEPLFESTIINFSSLAVTSISIGGLQHSSQYYVRVRASKDDITGDWSEVLGFRTIIGTPVLVSPADGDIDVELPPTLAWNPVNMATQYDLQVSVDEDFSTSAVVITGISETTRQVLGLQSGVTYYWRIRARNSHGTGGWSSVRSFRTEFVIPSAPTLLLPENASEGNPINLSLAWISEPGVATYEVQVSTNNQFTDLVVDASEIAESSFEVEDLGHNTLYHWRVRGTNEIGTGDWSEVWTFETVVGTPEITQPQDQAFGVPLEIAAVWSSIEGADAYQFQLSVDPTFSTTNLDLPSLTSTSLELSDLLYNTDYYIRVRSLKGSNSGEWSEVVRFRTILEVPVLTSPFNLATSVPLSPTLEWNEVFGDATYDFQVSTNVEFETVLIERSELETTSFEITDLQPDNEYFWRVRARNEGGPGDWSETWFFTTELPVPDIVQLLLPENGAVNQPESLLLSWAEATNASSYHIQVSVEEDFNTTVLDASNHPQTNYQLDDLQEGQTYYWRVLGQNVDFDGAWSPVWSFTIESPLPNTPELDAPLAGATIVPLNPLFSWNSVPRASSYEIQIATDELFTATILSDAQVATTTFQMNGLQYNTTYFWRVRGANPNGSGEWSETRSFITIRLSVTQTDEVELTAYNQARVTARVLETGDGSLINWGVCYSKTPEPDLNLSCLDANASESQFTFTLSSLDEGSQYFVRSFANSQFGVSYGNQRSFFTNLSVPLIVFPENSSINVSLTPTLNWIKRRAEYLTQVEVSTNASFNSTFFSQVFEGDSHMLFGLQAQTDYVWRIRHRTPDNAFFSDWVSSSFQTRPEPPQISARVSFNFPNNPGVNNFRMVGVPGRAGMPVSDIFQGVAGYDYRLFWDNGASVNYLIEYTEGSNWVFSPGKGYWAYARSNLAHDLVLPQVDSNELDKFTLELHPGWNIITNPFIQNVSWSNVQVGNAFSSPLFAFNGSFTQTDLLTPNVGYYVYNPDTEFRYLSIPFPDRVYGMNKEQPLKKSEESSPVLQFDYEMNGEAFSEILFKDLNIQGNSGHHPGLAFSSVGVAMYDVSISNDTTYFWEKHPSIKEGVYIANLAVVNKERTSIDVSCFFPSSDIPASCILYNTHDGRIYDLSESAIAGRILPTGSYLWITGDEQQVQAELDSQIPDEVELLSPWPNPFNSASSIRFSIPENNFVVLEIFDILGRRVDTLIRGELNAGWHQASFNASHLSSGLYMYRLVVGTTVKSGKMTLLK